LDLKEVREDCFGKDCNIKEGITIIEKYFKEVCSLSDDYIPTIDNLVLDAELEKRET